MAGPPYADLAAYAAAVDALVPDTKSDYPTTTAVEEALREYSQRYAATETVMVGDGVTREFELGNPGASGQQKLLERYEKGFSDLYPFQIERLQSDEAGGGGAGPGDQVQNRPPWPLFPGDDFWTDKRSVSGLEAWFLVFLHAPPGSPSVYRVTFRKVWTPEALPEPQQEAVVYLAAAIKCLSLASWYAQTIDSVSGSDLFSAQDAVDRYERLERKYRAKYQQRTHQTTASRLTTGRINTKRRGIWSSKRYTGREGLGG